MLKLQIKFCGKIFASPLNWKSAVLSSFQYGSCQALNNISDISNSFNNSRVAFCKQSCKSTGKTVSWIEPILQVMKPTFQSLNSDVIHMDELRMGHQLFYGEHNQNNCIKGRGTKTTTSNCSLLDFKHIVTNQFKSCISSAPWQQTTSKPTGACNAPQDKLRKTSSPCSTGRVSCSKCKCIYASKFNLGSQTCPQTLTA